MRRLFALLAGLLSSSIGLCDPPTVAMTYPPANATIREAISPTLLLQASASDVDDGVSSVGFLVCPAAGASCDSQAIVVGSAQSSPYQVSWTPPHVSATSSVSVRYLIWATASNSLGQQKNSSVVAVTLVQSPPAPSVKLVAPSAPIGFTSPAAPVLYATATAGNTTPPSTIARVDFLDGQDVIATVMAPNSVPTGYAYTWPNPSLGPHQIAARAVDTLGDSTISPPVTVYVFAGDQAPQAALTSPRSGQTFNGSSAISLTAVATSSGRPIERVEFVAGNNVVATSFAAPYAGSWVGPPPGNFAMVARAFDDMGVAAASPAAYVWVTADPRPPAVVLTAPAPGSTVPASSPLALGATALSPDGAIGRVDFYAGPTLIGSSPTAPYGFIWSSPSAGVQSLTAKAYDIKGRSGVSTPVAVTISGKVPSVSLTAPAAGARLTAPATIGLTATASEAGGSIVKVDFYANGALVATKATAPYNATWNGVAAGTYALTARATDNVGATQSSAAVTITVVNNVPPTAVLTAPTSNQAFTVGQAITITATASDPDGTVAKLEFLADGAVIGSVTASPFTKVWSGATAGTHALAVRATDNVGAITLSTPVTITVNSGTLPVVALTSPAPGDTFAAGGAIILAAAASSADGAIVRVDFYGGGTTLLGSATTAPYILSWTGAAPGTYSITAKATDARGAVATSASVDVRAITPALAITSPGVGASLPADFMIVTGTYQAPPNSGITVNGVIARNDGQGNFSANNVPLAAGANTLTVTLTIADGQSITQSQLVNSSAMAPMQIYADPDVDFAPATFTIAIKNRTAHAIASVAYTNLSGGQFDGSGATQTSLGKIFYPAPGLYAPTLTITDDVGNRYTQTLALLVRDRLATDQTLKAVWQRLRNALAAGDKAASLQSLTDGAKITYGPTFDALLVHFPAIVSTWSSPQASLINDAFAEYGINKTVDGINRVFLIDFVLDDDGVWRIDAM